MNDMPVISPERAGGQNMCAFLDMLAWSELEDELIALSDNGYNVIVGSTPAHPILFTDFV